MITIWNTKGLKEKLATNTLPEWQVFIYFFMVIVYDHAVFTLAKIKSG